MTWRVMLLALLLVVHSVNANINSDLSKFFDGLGLSSNVTAPHAYQGQQAGYYTGGSLFARAPVQNVQLLSVDLPTYRAGCGGIDLYSGGFSFIQSQQLVRTMQNILNNAAGYAFNLALESATPQIANVMNKMHQLANKVNQTNINTCQAGAALVGGLWPKTKVAQRQVCADIGTKSGLGLFTDWAQARQMCGMEGRLGDTLAQGNQANSRYESLIAVNTNVAWKALHLNGFLSNDDELAEFLMTLSGTIIIKNPSKKDDATPEYLPLPPQAADEAFLRAILYGGAVSVYVCEDTTRCLNPHFPTKDKTIKISADKALVNKIKALLSQIIDKIYDNEPLSDEEQGFLQSTRLPIYKMLNVQTAFKRNRSLLDVGRYADVIATDMLFQYLDGHLNVVRAAAARLNLPDALMKQFNQQVAQASEQLNQLEVSAYQRLQNMNLMITQTQRIEKKLAGTLATRLLRSYEWASQVRQ